jgi:hypothetical protein
MESIMHLSPPPRLVAYLDPGSGNLTIQMLIAVTVGGGLLLRTFWGKQNEDENEASVENDRRS